MPKLKRGTLLALLLGMAVTSAAVAGQDCRSEAEVPSSTPTSEFTDHGDGTVTHNVTGLMWMKCPVGQSGADCGTGSTSAYNWKDALIQAAGSGHAGYNDWRVPNINELRSIVERRCTAPAINLDPDAFPGTPGAYFWSSTPSNRGIEDAWTVYFHKGNSEDVPRIYLRALRLVRGGS